MKKFSSILISALFAVNCAHAQIGPVKGKGQAQSTFQTIERLETPNSSVTVTGDKAVLLEDGDNWLVNGSFEHQTFGTGWTVNAGTATVDTTNFYDGKKAMSISLTAVTGDILTQCVTPTQQKAGTNLFAAMRIKTTLANLQVCSVQGSTEVQCVNIGGADSWEDGRATSVAVNGSQCVKLKSTSSATGTVKVDSGYLGENRTQPSLAQNNRQVFSIISTTSQSTPHDTDTKLTFASPTITAQDACISYSAGTVTTNCTGKMAFKAEVRQTDVVDASVERQRIVKLYRGGAMIRRSGYTVGLAGNNINSGGTGNANPNVLLATDYFLVVPGQTFELYYYTANGSGTSRNINQAIWSIDFEPSEATKYVTPSNQKFTTVTTLTTGSGTYNTPNGVVAIRVKMTGGGGGSNGNSGTSCTSGSNGTSTTFGNATAILGQTGAVQGSCQGQTLASNSNTIARSVPIISSDSVCGQAGASANASAGTSGGNGGSNFLAIGGIGSGRENLGTVGRFGGGGGGTGSFANATFQGCGGGNSGGYLEFFVNSPDLSYSYSVGTGGAGGAGSRQNGVAGGNGIIIIEEFYGLTAPIVVGSVSSRSSFALDIESAKVSSTGVVSDETADFINGNCTSSSGPGTCTFNTGFFTNFVNCWASSGRVGGLNRTIDVYDATTTSVRIAIATANSGSSALVAEAFTLFCMGPK